MVNPNLLPNIKDGDLLEIYCKGAPPEHRVVLKVTSAFLIFHYGLESCNIQVEPLNLMSCMLLSMNAQVSLGLELAPTELDGVMCASIHYGSSVLIDPPPLKHARVDGMTSGPGLYHTYTRTQSLSR